MIKWLWDDGNARTPLVGGEEWATDLLTLLGEAEDPHRPPQHPRALWTCAWGCALGVHKRHVQQGSQKPQTESSPDGINSGMHL